MLIDQLIPFVHGGLIVIRSDMQLSLSVRL
jgi:hypothetical protein